MKEPHLKFYFCLFFAIFVFQSCNEESVCPMTISNALPIQFWTNPDEVFNQKDACGINDACFCQPFNCDDPLRIQIQDEPGLEFVMVILDENGSEIREQDLVEVSPGVYEYESTFENEINCGQTVTFRIANAILQNPGFDENPTPILNPWANHSTGVSWTNVSDAAFVNLTGGANSKILRQEIFLNEGTYTISFDYVVTGGTSVQIYIVIDGTAFFTDLIATSTPGTYTYSGTYTVNPGLAGSYYIGIQAYASGSPTLSVDNFALSRLVFAYSDCINVKANHDCTILLQYSNSGDYAGLVYEDISPQPEFYLRVPGVFFHDDFPQEQEDLELSDDTVQTLWNKTEAKRLLEINHMPYYMHQKLILALQHQFVTIDNLEWRKRDSYDIDRGNRRYPLKKATVLLSDKTFIKRNLL